MVHTLETRQKMSALRRARPSKYQDLTADSHSGTYESWSKMIARCHDHHNAAYKRYGGRGIRVCGRWRKFENFLNDMGQRPPQMQIERRDNNKGYSPGNCLWATANQQANNRRSNTLITYRGETKTLTAWARTLGISPMLVSTRIYQGWDVVRALETPRRPRGR